MHSEQEFSLSCCSGVGFFHSSQVLFFKGEGQIKYLKKLFYIRFCMCGMEGYGLVRVTWGSPEAGATCGYEPPIVPTQVLLRSGT